MTDKEYDMYCVLTELEVSIANKIETYIDANETKFCHVN